MVANEEDPVHAARDPRLEKDKISLQPLQVEQKPAPTRTKLRTAAILIALYVSFILTNLDCLHY